MDWTPMNWITYEHDESAADQLRRDILGGEPIVPIMGVAKEADICLKCMGIKTRMGFCLCS